MEFEFAKMHGLGNDFIVANGIGKPDLTKEDLQKLSDRHTGVGFDQILIVKPKRKLEAEYFIQIYNADGSWVDHCGNGMRCMALFLVDQGLVESKSFVLENGAGLVKAFVESADRVTIDLPLTETHSIEKDVVELDGSNFWLYDLKVGLPHAIVNLGDEKGWSALDLARWGARVAALDRFPQSANVGFVRPISGRRRLQLRTYERGVGPTLACGSNACAAALVAVAENLFGDNAAKSEAVEIEFELGDLEISLSPDNVVSMSGPAAYSFRGFVKL